MDAKRDKVEWRWGPSSDVNSIAVSDIINQSAVLYVWSAPDVPITQLEKTLRVIDDSIGRALLQLTYLCLFCSRFLLVCFFKCFFYGEGAVCRHNSKYYNPLFM